MPQPQLSPELFTAFQSKALEAFTVFAEMNHRVLQEFVGLSASTAKEGMRAYAELQSAAVQAAREAQDPAAGAHVFGDLRQDPFTWYQKGLLGAIEGTQKSFRFLEANGQLLTRGAERLRASADRTAEEIQEALTSSVGRVREIYARG